MVSQRERRIMGPAHHKAPVPVRDPGQDDEEERESKVRRMLSRALRARTQLTNTRATAEQRGCDRREK